MMCVHCHISWIICVFYYSCTLSPSLALNNQEYVILELHDLIPDIFNHQSMFIYAFPRNIKIYLKKYVLCEFLSHFMFKKLVFKISERASSVTEMSIMQGCTVYCTSSHSWFDVLKFTLGT
jgi:hypothetical protein